MARYNPNDPNGYAYADLIMSSPSGKSTRKSRRSYDVYDSIDNAADSVSSLQGIAQANSAFNAEQARIQREWTEQQSAKAMQFNAQEAAKNRDWQNLMSNTAHQREIADLKAAGLNPVLSAMNGNGASVGSGATASGVVGSGSKADADTSSSSAVANLLGSILSAQISLQNANINARTQQAVADKYNAMSEIVANISSAASLESARIHAGSTRYAADQASAANRYIADKTKYGMLDNVIGGIASILKGDSVHSAKSVGSGVKSAVKTASTAVKSASTVVKSRPGYVSWNDSLLGKAVNKLFKKK